jgi:5-methylthioadenosine/S-adenosylhomocysteine deaminase
MTAASVFELATLGGAAALGLEEEVGSLEVVKPDNVYSSIVYSGSPSNVRSVTVDGRWLLQDLALLAFDEEEVIHAAQREARALLERIVA